MLIVGNGRVITRDDKVAYLEHGAVAIDGDTISAVGDEDQIKAANPGADYVDAHGGVIMPGFVNCHTHIYSGLARGLSINGCDPHNFLENLEQQWWKIDRNLTLDGTRASAYATVLESLRNGVTTIFDHHASYKEIPGSLFAIKDVVEELGIRASLCYEVSDRDGKEKCDQAIQENADFARWAHDQNEQGNHMISGLFGGHATFTMPDEVMDQMAEANNGLTGYHIHVHEGLNDLMDSRENRGGIAPIERLMQHGLLGPDTLLVHCIHASPLEMDMIKETGTRVINNPQSNMNNAVGCAPILELFRRGIPVGMGTDAYTHDILQSLKTFIIIQRHNAGMPNVAWGEDMTMLFKNNPDFATHYFKRSIGALKPGDAADVIVMDYPTFTPFSDENIDGHMLFGMEGHDCRTTIVNGKVLYKDHEFVAFDAEKINAWVCDQAKQLWGTLNDRAY